MGDSVKKEFPRFKSVDKISKLPVVETGYNYASVIYSKLKNSNFLIRWGLGSVEGTVYMVLDKSLVAVPLIQMPLNIVDDIVYKGLEQVEMRVPAINYPPELLVNITKDYVSSKFILPVLKRADSVKQISLNGASKYGEMAVSRLDNALDVADKYVDKYLPDANDSFDSKGSPDSVQGNNSAKKAIEHASCLSRKLKRRLTRRTLAEARALKHQGVNTMQCVLYLADLLIRDPKQFMEKMSGVWAQLSEDEPENQVPPANLEQLIAMITREMARRFVHATNFSISIMSLMPKYTLHAFHMTSHHITFMVDYILKEALWSHIKCGRKVDEEPAIPLMPVPPTEPPAQNTEKAQQNGDEAGNEERVKKEHDINSTPSPKSQNASPNNFNSIDSNKEIVPNGDLPMKKVN